MPTTYYSLEILHGDALDGDEQPTITREQEEHDHLTNLTITAWVEKLAASGRGDSDVLPNHSFVGLHEDVFDRGVRAQRWLVRFYPMTGARSGEPVVTFEHYLDQLPDGSIVSMGTGYHSAELSVEQRETIYERVLLAAKRMKQADQ